LESLDILDTAIRTGIFQTFTRLLEGSALEQKLRGKDSYTLFAPVDIAFAYLPPDTLNHLLRAESQGRLADVLCCHALERKLMSHELQNFAKARTIFGRELVITNDSELRVDGARLLHLDIVARNGVIHGIDRLLLPVKSAVSASA
jgi:uncharacterized surface protein with fasciclin (FAS1) repeats